MDACRSCGGPLADGLDWCPRCFARVEAPGAQPLSVMTRRLPRRDPPPPAVYSRLRAGPTSFGALGRAVLTLLVLIGLVIGYPLTRGGVFAAVGLDVPGTPFLIAYCVVAGATAIYALSRIWKRSRVA